jgi:hypothetical protein
VSAVNVVLVQYSTGQEPVQAKSFASEKIWYQYSGNGQLLLWEFSYYSDVKKTNDSLSLCPPPPPMGRGAAAVWNQTIDCTVFSRFCVESPGRIGYNGKKGREPLRKRGIWDGPCETVRLRASLNAGGVKSAVMYNRFTLFSDFDFFQFHLYFTQFLSILYHP